MRGQGYTNQTRMEQYIHIQNERPGLHQLNPHETIN